MWTRFTWAVVIACCAAAAVRAQRGESPPVAGSPGAAPLRLVGPIMPTYPQIAAAARVTGKVVLQVTIAATGAVATVSVTRSIPLLDQSAIDAVRQWHFEPPTIDSRPAAVVVPVTLTFELHPRLAPVKPPTVRITAVPQDFHLVYEGRCPSPNNGRFLIDTSADTYSYTYSPAIGAITVVATLGLRPSDFEAMHRAVVDSRLLLERTDLRRWADPQGGPVILQDRIEVTVVGEEPVVDVQTTAQRIERNERDPQVRSTGWYIIDVRANGTWTRLWPSRSWPPAADLEPTVQRVRQTIEARIKDADAMRKLPREQQLCSFK